MTAGQVMATLSVLEVKRLVQSVARPPVRAGMTAGHQAGSRGSSQRTMSSMTCSRPSSLNGSWSILG